ncbi:C39 family peptidase [Microcoleus sp. C2C3]|uniref:C39 family peptidase n=1 Tax=unclassified Microcoleus TaxID=2642155 RepID=UPI002FD6BEAC
MLEIKLPVKYFNQVNNDAQYHGSGNRQCCLTANAMSAEYLCETRKLETFTERAKEWGLREPESAYGQILDKYGDTTDHDANTKALREVGLESYFSTSLSVRDLIKSLELNIPPAVGLHYKSSGHIVTIVGVNTKKEFFWVHDPYGVRAGIADYYEVIGGQSGKFDRYSFSIMKALWESMNDGWGRIFTHIGGMPTGL